MNAARVFTAKTRSGICGNMANEARVLEPAALKLTRSLDERKLAVCLSALSVGGRADMSLRELDWP